MHRQLKFLAVTILCASSLLWTPAAVAGQRASGRAQEAGSCGPLDHAERLLDLEHYTPLFTSEDEDPVASRADFGLERVSSGEPIHVVERPGDCAPVVAAAFRILNQEILSGSRVQRASENWSVLRFGPYYLVPIYPRSSELVAVQQYGQVLIFAMDEDVEEDDEDEDDEDDLRFLGWFLG
jgi:hypothetical protein